MHLAKPRPIQEHHASAARGRNVQSDDRVTEVSVTKKKEVCVKRRADVAIHIYALCS